MASKLSKDSRPTWPRRAIVTAGMPYGNKNLHFGHVGGVFIPADFYARFLRDRIGRENVLFVSGTDCYGSPIMESYRKLHDEQGYEKHISDYVEANHESQAATLAGYDVEPDFFGGSALEPAVHVHEQMTDEIILRLKEQGVLEKRATKQFFDPVAQQFLNGRQVTGRCPIQGCKSEKAYADECDLGHQFEPEELIAPKSALTGETPELRPVDNIYFYGIAQTAMWEALGWNMQQSTLVANYHVLYMGKKASSSSKTPPPPASELLDHYSAEQLRAHFLSLGLGEKPVSFSPKAYDLRETGKNPDGTPLLARDDKRVIDPVLKEGTLLTGVFNRLARSCFYGVAKKDGDPSTVRTGCIPAGEASAEATEAAEQAALAFEQAMWRTELHRALGVCDAFLRTANKRWSDASKAAKAAQKDDQAAGDALMHQALVDAFLELRVATVLMHGIVPAGCELICEHFDIAPEAFFSWEHVLDSTDALVESLGEKPGTHRVKELPPRFDFFSY